MKKRLQKLVIDFTGNYWMRLLRPSKLTLTLSVSFLTLALVPFMRKIAAE